MSKATDFWRYKPDRSKRMNPDSKVNPTSCAASVWGANGWYYKQCSRKGVIYADGVLWCRQHAKRYNLSDEARV